MDLKAEFHNNLRAVRDDHPNISVEEMLTIAHSWTMEKAIRCLDRLVEEKKDAHRDAVNKVLFDE